MPTGNLFPLLRLLVCTIISGLIFLAQFSHCALRGLLRERKKKKERSEERMNHYSIKRNGLSDSKDSVVCPKPRRPAPLDPSKILPWHLGHQVELCDARAGSELLDIILSKGGDGAERLSAQVPSSPPFFRGSPPSRVSNPIIRDVRFKEEKLPTVSSSQMLKSPGPRASPSSGSRKGGCLRANFMSNHPTVRVEGFNCLERDRRNCSIPALA